MRTILFLPLASSPASSLPSSLPWAPLHPLVVLHLPPVPGDPLGVFSGACSVALPHSTDPVYGWVVACCAQFHSVSLYPWRGCGMPCVIVDSSGF